MIECSPSSSSPIWLCARMMNTYRAPLLDTYLPALALEVCAADFLAVQVVHTPNEPLKFAEARVARVLVPTAAPWIIASAAMSTLSPVASTLTLSPAASATTAAALLALALPATRSWQAHQAQGCSLAHL